MSFTRVHEKGILLLVRVTPNASKISVTTENSDHLCVRLTAPPAEGQANKQLLKVIAKRLGVAPSRISMIRGLSSREKTLLVEDVTELEAISKLRAP